MIPDRLRQFVISLQEKFLGAGDSHAVVRNSGWLVADHAFRVVTGFLVGLWMARQLGPEQLGVLNYAIALITLLGVLATLNLDGIAVKRLLDQPDRQDEILSTTILLRISGSALCLILSLIAFLVLNPGDGFGLSVTLLVAAANILRSLNTVELWFQSKMIQKHVALNRIAAHALGAALRVGMILMALDVRYFAAAILVESALLAFFNLRRFARLSNSRLRLRDASMARARELLQRAWKLMFAGLVVAVFMRFDQLVLGQYFGTSKVGTYSIGIQMVEFFYVLPTVLMASIYPVLAGEFSRDERAYTDRLVMVIRLAILVTSAIALLISLTGDAIVAMLYGPAYAESALVLVYYVWVLPIVSIGVVVGHRYILKGNEIHTLFGTSMGAVTCIALSLVLIPRYGTGGAIATGVASHVVPTLFISLFIDRDVGRIILRSLGWGQRAA